MRPPRAVAVLAILTVAACNGSRDQRRRPAPAPTPAQRAPACPTRAQAPSLLPGIEARHRTLAYWLQRSSGLDDVLLSESEIAAHDRALAEPQADGKSLAWTDLTAPVNPEALKAELGERLGAMRERMVGGDYVDPTGGRLDAAAIAPFVVPDPLPPIEPHLVVALASIQLRCGPRREGLYKLPVDRTYNRNNCSTARAQEPIRVLLRWPHGPRLVRTRHALGWIDDDAPLSPTVPESLVAPLAAPPTSQLREATTLTSEDGATAELPAGTLLSEVAGDAGRFHFATTNGLHASQPVPPERVRAVHRPLTRRAVLEAAFSMLDTPYGWGGERGGRDCSGFVLDVLASFGLEVPRDSGRQALAGTDSIAVEPNRSERERLARIDEAARRGVVLLHFPGHIMLYLGRTESGTPMAIHAFAEYLEPCEGGGETLRTVDRVTVSDLSLGLGTTRRSFLQRITRIVVFGRRP